jgi:hypothetical protein
MSVLGDLALVGCCRSGITGSHELLSRLADYSRERGLGIGLLPSNLLLIQYFSDPNDRRDISLPHEVTQDRPAMLVDWGRAVVVVEQSGTLSLRNLTGNEMSTVPGNANLYGCALHKEAQRLLFWARTSKTAHYQFYLAELDRHRTWSLFQLDANSPRLGTTASFATADASLIRISVGFDSYLVRFNGEQLEKEAWHLEFAEGSPNGQLLAGRQTNGRLALYDLRTKAILDLGASVLGRCKWDPSSRYILAVTPTHGPPWCAPAEIVIVDAITREVLKVPAFVADARDHLYEWVLLPKMREDAS